MAFRDGEYHGVAHGSGIEFGGADQVAHIFEYRKVQPFRKVVQALAGHLGVQMAHASGVKLNGFDSSGFLDFDCVHIGIDVGFHHRYLDFVFDGIDGGNQGGGLAAARRGHQVKQKHPFLFEFRP